MSHQEHSECVWMLVPLLMQLTTRADILSQPEIAWCAVSVLFVLFVC